MAKIKRINFFKIFTPIFLLSSINYNVQPAPAALTLLISTSNTGADENWHELK